MRVAATGLALVLGAAALRGVEPPAVSVVEPPAIGASAQAAARTPALPARLSDAEFWRLVTDISEPGGYFRITDNFTSNEREVGLVFSLLRERGVKGGVYIGVGPEQNFSYIAASQPSMAFIIDIRRQAVMQHLMFKAVFELAKDRADFIALLFGKPRPAGLDRDTPIQRIWDAYFAVQTDLTAAMANRTRLVDHLTNTHKFAFTGDEARQLDYVITSFIDYGPSITTRGSGGGGANNITFADLTGWAYDATNTPQSFLSSDAHYQTVKALHDRNLIVPVSGDFGGPKALRAMGAWLTKTGATVNAFYVSNVEQYLFQDAKNMAFYENVATLPLTDASVFIRPYALRRGSSGAGLCPIAPFLKVAKDGRIFSNTDALSCPR